MKRNTFKTGSFSFFAIASLPIFLHLQPFLQQFRGFANRHGIMYQMEYKDATREILDLQRDPCK